MSVSGRARTVIPVHAVAAAAGGGRVVSLYEKQRKLYPRLVDGRFARWRWAFVFITQLVFYGLPWMRWNGRQPVLFDLAARRFYVFDLVLYPQDFVYLTAILVIAAYSLFFATALAGRLWCGYACPQTVYTEIFLWIERRIEGERGARMKLDAAPWSSGKVARKAAKHAAWLAIALWTGFTFVGYFTPIRTLFAEASSLALGPWELFWVAFYGLATWGNAGFLREQVCKYMCPYARFQSAMFDRDTLIVGYDAGRGEPRGPRSRRADHVAAGLGHCIDCNLCVHVCPVGIDIRDGLQYECIACTACIDACDGVMDKLRYPRGLIRYATLNGLERGGTLAVSLRHVARPRILIYGAVLATISAGLAIALAMRSPLKVDVVRDRGALARIVDQGRVENVYRLQLMNATETPQRYRIAAQGIEGIAVETREAVELPPAGARWVAVTVAIPAASALAIGPGSHPIRFSVEARPPADDVAVTEKSTFIVPR